MKTNYELRYAAHPEDARHYDTARLRRDFLVERVFAPNEVNMVYSMYDRMVVGGAMPADEELLLEAIDPLRAPYFTTRREAEQRCAGIKLRTPFKDAFVVAYRNGERVNK